MFNYLFVFIMGLLGTALLKFQSKLMAKRYFFYAHLIDGLEEKMSYLGVVVRTLMPFIIGVTSGGLAIKLKLTGAPQNYGMVTGFLSIFFLVWPDFLNPELISSTYRTRKGKLYTLYLILLIVFGLLGYLGGNTMNLIYSRHPGILSWLDFKGILNNLVAAAIFSTATAFVIHLYTNSFDSTLNKSDQSGTANRAAEGGNPSEG